jgi:3,4-dihydroxy 2-butanone 4-phosphate synthase/GTP cyclohydrolase II
MTDMIEVDEFALSSVEDVIADAKAGKMFILVDDDAPENEGDLCIIGENANAAAVNFMAKHGRGLICLALTRERTDQLGLSLMERRNESRDKTAFTVSIEAREGVTTGLSAKDRAHTIHTAISPQCSDKDITTPGHVFPLVACDGGTLVRAGHTEAVVDIARAADAGEPSGVLCKIMNDDGEMARLKDLVVFAREHDLKIASIAELIAWRRLNESLVQRTVESMITTHIGGNWRLVIYVNTITGVEHVALIKGDISADDPILVRMHRVDLLTDLLGQVSDKRTGNELRAAMQAISDRGRGIIVLLRESSDASLSSTLSQMIASGKGAADTPATAPKGNKRDSSQELREYGVGAQILSDLGIRRMILLSNTQSHVISLDGYDLEITGWQGLDL